MTQQTKQLTTTMEKMMKENASNIKLLSEIAKSQKESIDSLGMELAGLKRQLEEQFDSQKKRRADEINGRPSFTNIDENQSFEYADNVLWQDMVQSGTELKALLSPKEVDTIPVTHSPKAPISFVTAREFVAKPVVPTCRKHNVAKVKKVSKQDNDNFGRFFWTCPVEWNCGFRWSNEWSDTDSVSSDESVGGRQRHTP